MASIRKRGKTWEYRINHYDKDGKRDPIEKGGFRTKAEAKAEADRIEYELGIGMNVIKGDQLFLTYYKEWIKIYKLGVFSEETDRFYLNAVKLIEQYFPNTKLKEITKDDYQKFLNEYAKNEGGEERSKETVRKTHTKISTSIRDAVANGYIVHNPTHKITIRGTESKKDSEKYLDEEESILLLDELMNRIILNYTTRYMLILQLATGMRISEVMALQFKDFDFLNNTINIDKSWDYKETLDFKPTKNRETRVISVDKKTMKMMKEFYDYQLSHKVIDSKQRIFAVNGKIPDIKSVNKALKRACKRAGIQEVTSHALRHTHASLLLLNDVSLAYISRRLGHKNITITANTYSHVLKELQARSEEESADVFYNIYG